MVNWLIGYGVNQWVKVIASKAVGFLAN